MKYFGLMFILSLIQFCECEFTSEASLSDASIPMPESTDPLVREKLECLKLNKMSNNDIRTWYDRVLNPATRSGRVSKPDQVKVWGCLDLDDFLKFGVLPDEYTTTSTTTLAPVTEAWTTSSMRPSTTSNPLTDPANGANQKLIFDCLKDKGWSELRTRQFYNRVLNPVVSRSGLVSLFDQDLLRGCLDIPTPRLPPHTQSQYDSRPPSG